MQPHTGASITVIKFLKPIIRDHPELYANRHFYVRTTMPHKDKYHLISTGRFDPLSKIMHITAGKDYACYMEVSVETNWENFRFEKHRHTHIRESFRLFPGTRIDGEYLSESGIPHKLDGRSLTEKRIEFFDYFADEQSPTGKRLWKYEHEIIEQW